jgi:hypothetical protein
MNQTCTFEFPEAIAIPPIYNPPPPKIIACEAFTATTSLIASGAAKSTILNLIAAGPKECGIELTGIIDVQACEEFTANVDIDFGSSHRKAGSSAAITSTSSPQCGLNLTGYFDVLVCEELTVNTDVQFSGAADKGSSLLLGKTSEAPLCGLDLTGLINVQACETFEASADITFGGANEKGGSSISLVSRNQPECGLELTGVINALACEELTVNTDVQFGGAAEKGGSSIVLNTTSEAPLCGLNLTGNINVLACETFEADGTISITGAGVSGGPITVTSRTVPACGLTLSGDVSIDVCETFDASGSLDVTGMSGASGQLSVVSRGKPACGVDINGQIVLPQVCENFQLSVSGGSISISISSPCGGNSGTINLNPAVSVMGPPTCGATIALGSGSISLDVGNVQCEQNNYQSSSWGGGSSSWGGCSSSWGCCGCVTSTGQGCCAGCTYSACCGSYYDPSSNPDGCCTYSQCCWLSESSGGGSSKNSAIVPASWQKTGYTALSVVEAPEVRFEDVFDVTLYSEEELVPIDPRFVEVCEPGTLRVCGVVAEEPVLIGAKVKEDLIRIKVKQIDEEKWPLQATLKLTGVRRGFDWYRFPARTKAQYVANEAFINSAYPPFRE